MRRAQTLLEAVLAIGVILTATIGATTLVVSTISSGKTSEDKILAANLAREGLEIIRGIRDSNWLRRSQNVRDGNGELYRWDSPPEALVDIIPSLGPQVGRYYCFTVSKAGLSADWVLSSPTGGNAGVASPCDATTAEQLAKQGTAQLYTQGACPAGFTCSSSIFSRTVQVERVSEAAFAGTTEYLRVTAKVSWNDHGTKTYTISENLYDWR